MFRRPIFALHLAVLAFLPFASGFAQEGWTSLFNGKSLKGWKVLAGKARFSVEGGAIVGTSVANTGNTFLVTEKQYGDFILELEVRVDDSISNSGVQTRSHLDPAGNNGAGKVYGRQVDVDPTTRGWTGGIYDEGRRGWLYPLDLNPHARSAFRPKAYNKIRIECKGDEMRTWVNDIPAAILIDTVDREGFIGLQVHSVPESFAGKKTYFRNIRIRTGPFDFTPFPAYVHPVNLALNRLSEHERQTGWKLLFDGQSLSGWQMADGSAVPANGAWTVRDGILTVQSKTEVPGGRGDIISTENFQAFDFSFDFMVSPGGNSGVKYFVMLPGKQGEPALGFEYQLLDDERHPDAKMGVGGNRLQGGLYDLIAPVKQPRFIRPAGQWNTGRIIAYPDNVVEHYLNGVRVAIYHRFTPALQNLIAKSKYKDIPGFGERRSGPVLLQDHGDQVSFRNVRIKPLGNQL